MDISQEVVDLIVANKDKDDNEIAGIIIGQGGVSFKDAKSVLSKVLIDQGLRLTKEQLDEKAVGIMSGFTASEDSTSDEVNEIIEDLVEGLDCTNKKARAYVRAAFTAEDLEMPKAARASGGPRAPSEPGFSGVAKVTTDFFIENPNCTKEEFTAFMEEKDIAKTKGGVDKTTRWYSYMQDLKIFATKWCESGNC